MRPPRMGGVDRRFASLACGRALARARLQHPQLALIDGELDVGVIQVIGTTAVIMLDKLLHSLDALEILLVPAHNPHG